MADTTYGYSHVSPYHDTKILAPPRYEDSQGSPEHLQPLLNGAALVQDDGRFRLDLDKSGLRFSKLLAHTLRNQPNEPPPPYVSHSKPLPSGLNIVIQVVGSRGDVQPFLPIALILQKHGHRVRIATHTRFRSFVQDTGLEFFDIGGDPMELMSYMVRNPGLLPTFGSIVDGSVQSKREMIRTILENCWRSCIEANDDTMDHDKLLKSRPFVADAIIANPPSFAHIHCAEKLGVPLHIMFTMPWSPTQAFAHPLVNIKSNKTDPKMANYLSYLVVETMIWQGLGGMINSFRSKDLGLQPIHSTWAPAMMTQLRIPHTYLWSPNLATKPQDWNSHVDIAGFSFLHANADYAPSKELKKFLSQRDRPIYIGFGSIVVEDPAALTAIIFEAVKLAGVRAIISQGWAHIGDTTTCPPDILMLGDCPHDWLFQQVACVVHHGGAGTTAAGLASGRPSIIIPFFGDQFYWGRVVADAGVGPESIPARLLTAENLAAAIKVAMSPEMRAASEILSQKVKDDSGAQAAVKSFYRYLNVKECSVQPGRSAVWVSKRDKSVLSSLAAIVLSKEALIDFGDFRLFQQCSYELDHGPWEPVSGGSLAVTNLFYETFKGIGEIGSDLIKSSSKLSFRSTNLNGIQLTEKPTSKPPAKRFSMQSGILTGSARIFKAAARSPMTFTTGMAQGSHNIPKLWGDKTVRPHYKIEGLGSGLVAGGRELVLGVYDGIAGLVVQPVLGAKEEGVVGFVKGIAQGVASFVPKWFAAASGVVGYPLKGVDVGIQNLVRRRQGRIVREVRMFCAEQDYLESTEQEREEIVRKWKADHT